MKKETIKESDFITYDDLDKTFSVYLDDLISGTKEPKLNSGTLAIALVDMIDKQESSKEEKNIKEKSFANVMDEYKEAIDKAEKKEEIKIIKAEKKAKCPVHNLKKLFA